MICCDHGYGRPSLRAVGSILRGVVPYPPAWKSYGLEAGTESSRKPGVLGRRLLRRTIQVRLGFEFGFWISDLGFLATIDNITPNSSDFTICSQSLTNIFASFQSAFRNPPSAIVYPVARPPRLSEQARDGGQARPSSRSRDSNS
jgi:hypothetical protein